MGCVALEGRRIGDGQVGADVAAARARVDVQRRALADPDLGVAGGRFQVHAALDRAADHLVAGGRVDVHGRASLLDGHVAGGAVDLDVARGRAEKHVAGGRVQLGVSGHGVDPLVAGGGVEPCLAADRPDGDVAAGRVHPRFSDLVQLDVARAGLDLDRAVAAAGLDVARAALRVDLGSVWTADVDPDLRPAREAEAASAVADLRHDLVDAAALTQLETCVLDRLAARVVVPQRLERDDRLPVLAAGEPDLACPEP